MGLQAEVRRVNLRILAGDKIDEDFSNLKHQESINSRQLEANNDNRKVEPGLLTFMVENWRPVNPYDLSDPA